MRDIQSATQPGTQPSSEESRTSTTAWLFDEMLERIKTGRWPVGSDIPSERTLIAEFGVSRIALRESLSMLRSLGVIETAHGRSSTVRRIDACVLAKLFPLMLSLEGEQTFDHVFEIRLAIECPAAALAATRRSESDLARLAELIDLFRRQADENLTSRVETDLELHLAIARATQNPLYAAILMSISGYVVYAQTACCNDDAEIRRRAVESHAEIVGAIAARDAERARAEMEVHLRNNAARARDSRGLRTNTHLTIGE